MSQLASFTQLPIPAVQHLIPAAIIRKRWFKKPESDFQNYLEKHGVELDAFVGDGMYIMLILMYLRSFCELNLLDGNKGLALMATSLAKHQGSTFAFLTDENRDRHSAVRSAEINIQKLRSLCKKEDIDFELLSDIGTLKAARDKIAEVLAAIPDDHVVLLSIG